MGVGTGVYQLLKGNEAADTEQPKYEIPKEYTQALGMAKQASYSNMPGYQQAISNLQQSDASSFERAKDVSDSGGNLLGFLANRGVTSNRGLNQLAAQNAAYKVGAEQRYMGALGQYGLLKDKQWNINEMQPYQDAMRTSAVMTEGGIQNIFGGITGGIQNYAALKQANSYQALADKQLTYYDYLMGGNKDLPQSTPTTTSAASGFTNPLTIPQANLSMPQGQGWGGMGGLGQGFQTPQVQMNTVPVSNLGLAQQPQVTSYLGYPYQQASLMDSYGYGNYYNYFQ